MAWGQDFLTQSSKSRARPRYMLEHVPIPGYLPGAGLSRHSHSGWAGFPATITRVGSSVSAGHLTVRSWSYTTGSLSIGLRSNLDPRLNLPRGVLVRLRVGYAGWSDADYETVWLGQVQDITQDIRQGVWVLQVKSIVGALVSRFSQTSQQASLFYSLPAETTVATTDYAAGAANLTLAGTSGLERLTGGTYLVRVTPNSGDPFYVTSTTLVGNQLQTVTAGAFGTTDADADIGARVEFMAYLPKNPVEAALTVLTSTGAATNGTYDTAPSSWGLALPQEYVDAEDAERTRDLVTAGIGTYWDLYTGDEQPDAAGWLRSFLQTGGLWLAERQGAVTVRAVEAPGQYSYEIASIFDSEIVDLRYNTFDPNQPVEYGVFNTYTAAGGSTSPDSLSSRPMVDRYEIDYTGVINTNESTWRTNLASRLGPWYLWVGESFEITLRGWRLASLCPGDAVIVSSRYLSVRSGIEGLSLVTSVQPDWFGATTRIRCVHNVNMGEFPQ